MSSGNDKEIRIGIEAETSGADEAKRALEGVKRAAEEAAEASNGVKPMGDGSQVADSGATKAVEEMTAAVLEEVEANGVLIDSLDELTDAEAGVVRSTGKVSEEFKKVSEEGKKLKALELGQGMAKAGEVFSNIAGVFGQMGKELKDVNPELAETATKVGHVAGTLSSVATGVAQGGIAGGVLALIGDLGKTWVETYTAIEKIEADAAARIEQTNEGIRQRHEELARAQGEAEESSFIDHLGVEAEAYDEINAAIERNIELQKTKRQGELEVEDAKAGLETAKIDADPNLSDEEKIKRKAAVNEGLERKKTQAELDDLTDQYKAAQSRGQKATEESRAQDKKVEDIKASLEKNQAKARELEAKPDRSDIENGELKRALAAVGEDRERLPGEEKRRDELRGTAYNTRQVESNNMAKATIEAKSIMERYSVERETREVQTGQRAGRARESEEREKKRKEDHAGQEKDRREEQGARGRLNQSAMDASGKFSSAADFLKSRGNSPELAKTLGGIGKGLSDGTDDKEIAELSKQFAEATKGTKSATLDALKSMLDAQMKQAEEIRKLQGNLKNGGPHK